MARSIHLAGPITASGLILALSGLAFITNQPTQAQSAGARASGSSSAQIVTPLTIEAASDLEFGALAVSADDDGSVTIGAVSTNATYVGSARPLCGLQAACGTSPARFLVTGEAGRSYLIQVPDILAADAISGGQSLRVDQLTVASRNIPGAVASGRLDNTGSDEISLGGTLHVPSGAPAGAYRAQVRIVVSYS